ncbi:sensor histidine kinase [Nocardia camponoti]|uniref:histidine kinase n=1 Tax=Nocardia camponoti TaxID=1616106 RepID=A0A917V5R5_9NOCA|nr:histidine kinase [Nocardia camponoti]GGK43884.1 two-component sensor histidine kinase [Nocardia camponoti]
MTQPLPASRKRPDVATWFDLGTVVVALILYSIAWPTLFVTHEVAPAFAPVFAAFAAFPILLVRVNPAVGWAVSAGAALVFSIVLTPTAGTDLPFEVVHVIVLFVLLFAVALRCAVPVIVAAWAATSMLFATTMPGSAEGPLWGWVVGLGALALFGYLIRTVIASQRTLARQAEENELERARRTVLEEKARIARDLHDVVAHHMSLVVVQAQTAPYRLTDLSEPARAEFESIGVAARTALNEVRSLLGVLRSDGQLPEHAPQPRAVDVPELCASAKRAGVPIDWSVAGQLSVVPDTTGLVVYRVVQESLSNAARHAPGAAVRVLISVNATQVRIEVVNHAAVGVQHAAESGNGIDGMRARVAALGGQFSAGPTHDGGFAVVATMAMDTSLVPIST